MPTHSTMTDAELKQELKTTADRLADGRLGKRTRVKLLGRRGRPLVRGNFVAGQYHISGQAVPFADLFTVTEGDVLSLLVPDVGWRIANPSFGVNARSTVNFSEAAIQALKGYDDLYFELDITMDQIVDTPGDQNGHASPTVGVYLLEDNTWNVASWVEIYRGCYPFGTQDTVPLNAAIPGPRVMVNNNMGVKGLPPQDTNFGERFTVGAAYKVEEGIFNAGKKGDKEARVVTVAYPFPVNLISLGVYATRNKRSTGGSPASGTGTGGGMSRITLHGITVYGSNRKKDIAPKDRAPIVQL